MNMPNLKNKVDQEEISSHVVGGYLDVKEFLLIYQPTKPKIVKNSKNDKIVLESKEKAKKILCKDSVHFGRECHVECYSKIGKTTSF